MSEKIIRKIVFTGGPGGGKSSLIPHARKYLESLGWYVIVIKEMATMFDESGLGPTKVIRSADTGLAFQREVMETQVRLESSSEALAKNLDSTQIAVLCDRALCDQIAYVGESNFEELLRSIHIGSIAAAKNRYDAIIHMVTAADGAEEFYINKEKDPNSPRGENLEEARILDEKTKRAWLGHPHYAIINNSTDFPEKIHHALVALGGFLGLPEPFEIERKFLIKLPSLEKLYTPDFREYIIRQAYLKTDAENVEERIRMETGEGGVHYTHTKKIGFGLKRIEIENDISTREYREFFGRLNFAARAILKTRYRMLYENQLIEIDVYPDWHDHAILEVELRDENDPVAIPDFIEVVREVTGESAFSNRVLAFSPPSRTL